MSLERLRETEKYTPKEREWRNPDKDPNDKKWLKKGEVQLESMSMRYAEDLDPVLKVWIGMVLSIFCIVYM